DRLTHAPIVLKVRLAMAHVALAAARPEDTLSILRSAGPTAADDPPAQLLQGDARLALGEVAGARAAYQRATALEPSVAAGFDRLGRLALSQGQWEAAKQAFTAAREREPAEPGHAFRLGLALWSVGQQEAA